MDLNFSVFNFGAEFMTSLERLKNFWTFTSSEESETCKCFFDSSNDKSSSSAKISLNEKSILQKMNEKSFEKSSSSLNEKNSSEKSLNSLNFFTLFEKLSI